MRDGHDDYLYILKIYKKVIIYILVYVNDILMESSHNEETGRFKGKLNFEFGMNNFRV